ncbi:MAG: TolC family outer membrane protein [Pseudomonadota bacterium]
MRFGKRTVSAWLFCVLSFSPAGSHALSLSEAVLYVIETNPEIASAEANKQAIEFELDQADTFFLPRVSLEGSLGYSFNDGSTTSDLPAADDPIGGYEVSARISQRLFDGFETRSEIERQAYRVDAAALRVLERAEFLSLEAARVYSEVLRARSLVALARDNVSYHRQVFARITRAVDNGVVGFADQQQAEERVFLAEDTLAQTILNQGEIEADFLGVVGVDPDRLSAIPRLSASLPATLDQALAVARTSNPTLRFRQADVGTAEALSRKIDANQYPSLNLEAEARYGEDVNGFEGEVQDFQVGLVLRYEFQGGQKRALRQEHARRVGESRAQLLSQARLVEREVRQSWASLETTRRRVALIQRQAGLALEVRESYVREFEVGQRSLLDILNTQSALFQAESSLINARSLETFIEYRVLAAMGRLLPSLGVEPPSDAIPYAAQLKSAPGVGSQPEKELLDPKSLRDWRKSLDQ